MVSNSNIRDVVKLLLSKVSPRCDEHTRTGSHLVFGRPGWRGWFESFSQSAGWRVGWRVGRWRSLVGRSAQTRRLMRHTAFGVDRRSDARFTNGICDHIVGFCSTESYKNLSSQDDFDW